jgi:TetR/AcrR family fatty acid metabolism transcriptional regulator
MDEKKQIILQSAMKVFAEVGFHRAKISKIAEIAGVGAGSVYLYFENKENILEEIFIESWSHIEQTIQRLFDDDNLAPDSKLEELIAEIISMSTKNPDLSRLVLHEHTFWSSDQSSKLKAMVDNVKSQLVKIIEKGSASGCFSKSLDSELAGTFLIGGLWHTLSFIVESRPNSELSDMQSKIVSLVLRGIMQTA